MLGDPWYEERLLIGGKLVQAADGASFDNVNPATEEVIGVAGFEEYLGTKVIARGV